MFDFVMKRLAPGYDDPLNEAARARAGVMAGAAGVALNLALFAAKLIIALLSGSVAVLSDAFNNISDTGSSLVSLIGMRVAARRPDREHPFGHGRAEYVSALVVAMMIFLVAVELLKESIKKLIAPETVVVSTPMLLVLGASILIKLGMFAFNRALGRRIDSSVLTAAASDSLNDVVVTSVIVLSAFFATRYGWNVDAPAGILVSLFIIYGGVKIAREVVTLLIGGRPDPELMKKIEREVLSGEGIAGVHDLIVHDYGPGRRMASVHAEVDAAADMVKIHESIDAAERRILKDLGVPVVIHMDPLPMGCDRTNALRAKVEEIISTVNPRFSIHDFRVVEDGGLALIFDLAVPGEMPEDERAAALKKIEAAAEAVEPGCKLVVQVDSEYAP